MSSWRTEGCFPGRVPIPYTDNENASGKLVFSSPDSRPVERKFRDLLQWINESLQEGKLLDVGSGAGNLSFWSVRLGYPFQIYNYDQCLHFLQITQSRNGQVNTQVNSDLPSLPYIDNSFNGVLFSDVLEHITPENAEKAVEESRRVLNPNGWIFINIPNRNTWTRDSHNNPRHIWLPSRKEMIELLMENGFDKNSVRLATRGFPGSNLFHQITESTIDRPGDLHLPLGGRSILIKAQKIAREKNNCHD